MNYCRLECFLRVIVTYSALLSCLCLLGCGRLNFEDDPFLILASDAGQDAAQDGTFVATCSDGVINQHEEKVDCGGECAPCVAVTSCADLRAQKPGSVSQVYEIDVDGNGPIAAFLAYCEMNADGGGWTLAAKMDGAQQTFSYESPLWVDDQVLSANAPALDNTQAKLQSFVSMPFRELRLGLKVGVTTRWMVMSASQLSAALGAAPFSSLRSVFNRGANLTTNLGRAEWLKLIDNAAIQLNCNREGFNIVADDAGIHPQARIGIFGNNETDCVGPDSYLGFGGLSGTFASTTGSFDTVVGNGAVWNNAGGGDRNTYAMGYIMVR